MLFLCFIAVEAVLEQAGTRLVNPSGRTSWPLPSFVGGRAEAFHVWTASCLAGTWMELLVSSRSWSLSSFLVWLRTCFSAPKRQWNGRGAHRRQGAEQPSGDQIAVASARPIASNQTAS